MIRIYWIHTLCMVPLYVSCFLEGTKHERYKNDIDAPMSQEELDQIKEFKNIDEILIKRLDREQLCARLLTRGLVKLEETPPESLPHKKRLPKVLPKVLPQMVVPEKKKRQVPVKRKIKEIPLEKSIKKQNKIIVRKSTRNKY